MGPFIDDPLRLGQNLGLKLAKYPQLPSSAIDKIIQDHGARDFEDLLRSTLTSFGFVAYAKTLSSDLDLFDVWTHLRIRSPPIRCLTGPESFSTVYAAPTTTRGWKKSIVPAQFGTILIVRDLEAIGIHSA